MNIKFLKFLVLITLSPLLQATKSKEIILDTSALAPSAIIEAPPASELQPPKQTEPKGVIIIIHGTFATDTEWYQPGGDFFEVIKSAALKRNYNVIPFSWSGELSNTARIAASKKLAQLILSYPSTINIEIIAHSYGGAVANYASALLYNPVEEAAQNQEKRPSGQSILNDLMQAKKEAQKQLETINAYQKTAQPQAENSFVKTIAEFQKKMQEYQKQALEKEVTAITATTQEIKDFLQAEKKLNNKTKNKIKCLYTLAIPVDEKQHLPNYFVIKHLKNFYSDSDFIQLVFGMCQRVFPPHPQLINIKVKTAKTPTDTELADPGHSELHSVVIGKQLLDIFEPLKKRKFEGWQKASFGINGQITFFEDQSNPKFEKI